MTERDDATIRHDVLTDGRAGIQVIRRAVSVLRTLAEHRGEGLSHGAIATKVGLPRSTIQRIIGALEEDRLVVQSTGGSRLGPAIAELAAGLNDSPLDTLRSAMHELHEAVNESVALCVLGDGNIVVMETLSCTQPLRVVLTPVSIVGLFSSAPGKAILTALPEKEQSAIIASAKRDTRIDVARLQREMADVRKLGYAVEEEEEFADVSAIAIAVATRDTYYALAMPVPSGRFRTRRETLVKALIDQGARLHRRLRNAT
ncbi:MAG: IclR family transcriptional regulator [Janthinobacterium lividum]